MDNWTQVYVALPSDFEQFKRERSKVLTELDLPAYRAYMDKYNPDMHDMIARMDDEQLLRSIHLARLQADFISDEDKQLSADWLKQRGYKGWEGIL